MRIKRTSQRAQIRNLFVVLAAFAAGKAWCADNTNSPGSTDPLLDLFVKKGYVTQQEAEQVQAEAKSAQTNNASWQAQEASKWKMVPGIKNMELYGDIRLRYEGRTASDIADNAIKLQRIRYALRFGLRGQAFDDFYYGIRLETGASPRSSWVTLGTSANNSPYQGPFGKSTDGINVGQAYIGWNPANWIDITIGKMPNLLYTTPMVWSPNINPEGLMERFNYDVGQANFFANFGQYTYADLNPEFASSGLGVNVLGAGGGGGGQDTRRILMFAWQGGFTYHVDPTTYAKIAATVYNYTGLKASAANDPSTSPYFGDPYIGEGASYLYGGPNFGFAPGYAGYSPGTQFNSLPGGGNASVSYPFNQVGLNDLLILEIPAEFDFRIKNIAARVFGDFAYNLEGASRAQAAANGYTAIINNAILSGIPGNTLNHSFPAQTHDVKAYQIGIGFGSDDLVYGPTQGTVYGTSTHKGDWEFRTYWQHIEQYSLDPNILDSDFFEGRENLEGIYAAVAYALSDNFILTVRYGFARRINDLIGTGGDNQDIPQMNPINHYFLLQTDATLRF